VRDMPISVWLGGWTVVKKLAERRILVSCRRDICDFSVVSQLGLKAALPISVYGQTLLATPISA
jgi:hypothetical protein